MFGKVKKVLGIEGVKLELILTHPFTNDGENLHGTIKLTTKTVSDIESIHVRLIEKYARGRSKTRLIDEYVLGELELKEQIHIEPEEIIEVPFELEYVRLRSEIDKMADDNLFMRGPVLLAKYLKKVESEFRLEANAHVKGTKLQPFAEIYLT